jgi:hypothetical protein
VISGLRPPARWRARGAPSPAGWPRRSRWTGQRGAWRPWGSGGRCPAPGCPRLVRGGQPPAASPWLAAASSHMRYACLRRGRLRVSAAPRTGLAAVQAFMAPGCRSASAGLPGTAPESWGSAPNTPHRRALRVRWVPRLALQPQKARGLRWLRRAPFWGVTAPAHPAPSPSSPSAAHPARLPCAAGGASAPAAPRGAQAAREKPQPGQAE